MRLENFYFVWGLVFVAFAATANHKQSAAPPAIRFVENKNQWPSGVLYGAELPGGKLFLEKDRFTYVFYDQKILAGLHHHHLEREEGLAQERRIEEGSPEVPVMKLHAFEMHMLGANPEAVLLSEHKNPELNNFYIGNDPARWASGANSFGKVVYKNIYQDIDLAVFETKGTLKYEFILAPGAEPSVIKLQYNGADSLFLQNGALHIATSVGEIVEKAPVIYQMREGHYVEVPGAFVLSESVITFQIEEYDKKIPLVIDPELIFSTYSGSVADNWGNTAAFDNAGNMYSGGTVFGAYYPTTLGAYQESFAGTSSPGWGIDVGILKFNASGSSLLYCTYLGGFYTDVPYSLIVDHDENLVIMGATGSANFPVTTGAFDAVFKGGFGFAQPVPGITFVNGTDLFLSKLSASGTSLLASTYIGGFDNEGLLFENEALTKNYGDQMRGDVTVDKDNNIYVASNTRSNSFPVTPGAAQTTRGGGMQDACVFKLNSSLTTLIWSTLLGGSDEDAAFSLQVDSLNNVFVAGGTTSTNFPTTTGVLHPSFQGTVDGFVTHIAQDGSSFISSTYLGTNAYDQAYFLQLDTLENVYVLGQTRGAYPVSPGVYRNPNSGQFIHKLSNDLKTSLMSTVVGTGGNRPNISPTAFLVNDCGNIFLSGWGGVANESITNRNGFLFYTGYVGGSTHGLPVTPDAYRSITDGSDFYIMVLGKDASSLLYGTFFGAYGLADHVDGGTSRFDKRGIIYEAVCAGCGGSSAFPTTPGAWSNVNNSNNCNNAAFKFDLSNLRADFKIDKDTVCAGTGVVLTNTSSGGKSFFWDLGDGTTSTSYGPIRHVYQRPGTYEIMLIATDLTTCIAKDTLKKEVTILAPPNIVLQTADTSMCYGDSIRLQATYNPHYQYQWSPSATLSDDTIANPYSYTRQPTTYQLVVRDTNNCEARRAVRLNVVEVVKEIEWEQEADCEGLLKVTFVNKTANALFNWDFGDGRRLAQHRWGDVMHLYEKGGTYTVTLDIDGNGCEATHSITFPIEDVFIPNLITPNSDGENDFYTIKGITQNWDLEIYNGWGDLVYKNSNYENQWDGAGLSDGVYFFLITSPNENRCKGWVQIVR